MPTYREIDWYKNRISFFLDEYSLKMAQDFYLSGVHDIGIFEMFCRKLPQNRDYLVAFGADTLVAAMENFRFDTDCIDWLKQKGYDERFLNFLKTWKFSGQIYAMLDGTVFFPNEPIVQVAAPIYEAVMLEGLILNIIHRQTCIGTKATRIKLACGDKPVVDFSLRGCHGMDDALWTAKASHIAGFSGTSNVSAARVLEIESKGTMAHLYVLSKDFEREAFLSYAKRYPNTVVLIDTYNTIRGAKIVADLLKYHPDEFKISAVRIDSYSSMDDLVEQCKEIRKILDAIGAWDVGILPTGDMEEYKIKELLERAGHCINGLAVGRQLADIDDAPKFNTAYKLVEFKGKGRMKTAYGKYNFPLRKQVLRNENNLVDIVITYDKYGEYQDWLPGEKLLVKIYDENGMVPIVKDICKNASENREFIEKIKDHLDIYIVDIDKEIISTLEHIIKEKEVVNYEKR